MSNPVIPMGAIRVVQDGDVYRILDSEGRRYTVEGHWEAEPGFMTDADRAIWARLTAFSEREAQYLVDALQREQRARAQADMFAATLTIFDTAREAAKAWQSRRRDG
jgi:cytochrome c556